MTTVRVYVSSCGAGPSLYDRELRRFAGLARRIDTRFVERPEEADLILVVDMDEAGLFANLRRNPLWRRWPKKAFGVYEGDNPPRFLHGLYSGARNAWSRAGRYLSCPYPMHQICFPSAEPPLAEIRDCPKDLLFSFSGRASHRIRKRLFCLPFPQDAVVIQDTSNYNHFATEGEDREAAQRRYWQLAARSKFVLCPRGAGTSSIRLFEMLEAGIAPVIISDDWIPPHGPRWDEFALRMPERDVGRVYEIVKSHEGEFGERGLKARRAYEGFFARPVLGIPAGFDRASSAHAASTRGGLYEGFAFACGAGVGTPRWHPCNDVCQTSGQGLPGISDQEAKRISSDR